MRHPGYQASQRVRKRIEEASAGSTLSAAAFNLVRLRKLLATG